MIKYSLTALALMVALTGCSYLPAWMGGKKPEITRLPGERISVLPASSALQPDSSLQTITVNVPAPDQNSEWAQHSGVHGNLSLRGNLDVMKNARMGDGEAFESSLVYPPVAGGDAVFAMDATGQISAHRADNIHTLLWQSKGVAEKGEPAIWGGGLAYAQGMLFATSGRGIVAAFDAKTGKELWRKALRVPFRSAPRIADGRLFAVTVDSQAYALSAANGDVLWTQRGIGETAGLLKAVSPAVTGPAVIVPYASGEIYTLIASDGKEVWSDTLTPGKRTLASGLFSGIGGDPLVEGDILFAVSGGGMLAAFHAPSGQRLWERPVGSLNTPWLAGDYLFLLTNDNTLVAFLKYDGRVRWSTRLKSFEDEEEKRRPINWYGPVLVNGKLAVVSSNGEMLMAATGDGSIVSSLSVPEGIQAAPVVAGGRMYFVTQDATLYALQ